MINKDKLVFDPADLAASDDVGAYLRSSDGTLLTHTDVGGKKSLDVFVANEIDVAISHLTDSIRIGDGVDLLEVNPDGSINAVVTATDLDIRNIVATQDNIAIRNSTNANELLINADGSINVNADISIVNGHEKLEDQAHLSGDVGSYVLAVRQDTLVVDTSASGDYASFKVDALGRLQTNDAAQDALFSAVTVTTAATALVASPLANRRKILVQNVSTRTIYVGEAGVTTATGIRLAAGSSIELEAAPQISLFAIAQGGSADVRVLELA